MKNTLKVAIIILILVVISVILFITGKRHDILIENNSSTGIKYSINGEPYKTLDTGNDKRDRECNFYKNKWQ